MLKVDLEDEIKIQPLHAVACHAKWQLKKNYSIPTEVTHPMFQNAENKQENEFTSRGYSIEAEATTKAT